MTLTASVAWCLNTSETVIVQLPAATEVAVNAPLATDPNVTMPPHPLTVKLLVPGSVIVTLCVSAAALNVSDVGETDSGPKGTVETPPPHPLMQTKTNPSHAVRQQRFENT